MYLLTSNLGRPIFINDYSVPTMQIKRFEFNPFGECTYILYDEPSKEAAIIDPGMMDATECEHIDAFVKAQSLKIKYLISTHMHIDHVAGVDYLKNLYGIGLSASPADAFLSERIGEQAKMFGLRTNISDSIDIDIPLHDGDIIFLGKEPVEIIAVPGHSPGGIALYSPNGRLVITGDALFQGSIGRTDLPGGDYATLINSIRKRLMTLPDSTVVYPGHGPKTTIGIEKELNPYV